MKVFVVTCYMEGCEECGNEYHVVGVASTTTMAEKLKKDHESLEHLHPQYVYITECDVDNEC